MVDIHSHIIHSVDDGSDSIETSLKMIKEELSQGVDKIILTPHLRHGIFEVADEKIRENFIELKNKCKEQNLPVELYLGREITLYKNLFHDIKNGNFIPLSNEKYILIEFPYYNDVGIDEVCYNIDLLGFIPVIAHVERYEYFRTVENVKSAKAVGALIQVNASSIIGKSGAKEKKFVKLLLKNKLVDFVGSDYHMHRENFMKSAYLKVAKKDEDYANKIFTTNALKFL